MNLIKINFLLFLLTLTAGTVIAQKNTQERIIGKWISTSNRYDSLGNILNYPDTLIFNKDQTYTFTKEKSTGTKKYYIGLAGKGEYDKLLLDYGYDIIVLDRKNLVLQRTIGQENVSQIIRITEGFKRIKN